MSFVNKFGAAIKNLSGAHLSSTEAKNAVKGTILGVKSTSLETALTNLKEDHPNRFGRFDGRVKSTFTASQKSCDDFFNVVEKHKVAIEAALSDYNNKKYNPEQALELGIKLPVKPSEDSASNDEDIKNIEKFIKFALKNPKNRDTRERIFKSSELNVLSNYNHAKHLNLNTVHNALQGYSGDEGTGATAANKTPESPYAAIKHSGTNQGEVAEQEPDNASRDQREVTQEDTPKEITYADISQFQKRDGQRVNIGGKGEPNPPPAPSRPSTPPPRPSTPPPGPQAPPPGPQAPPPQAAAAQPLFRSTPDNPLDKDSLVQLINEEIDELYDSEPQCEVLKTVVNDLAKRGGVTAEQLDCLVITTSANKEATAKERAGRGHSNCTMLWFSETMQKPTMLGEENGKRKAFSHTDPSKFSSALDLLQGYLQKDAERLSSLKKAE